MNLERIHYLFDQYDQQQATEAEKEELLNWLNDPAHRGVIEEVLTYKLQTQSPVALNRMAWEPVLQQILLTLPSVKEVKSTQVVLFRKIVAAAAMLLLAIGIWWLIANNQADEKQSTSVVANVDITPGGDRATLTLADGTQILLDSAANGSLAQQGTTHLIKSDGQLAYQQGGISKEHGALAYNTIHTPKRGQYQLVLSDGSKVWLNAESSLKFPVAFTDKQRSVELTGEAYFEVSSQDNHTQTKATPPFTVRVLNALGTQTAVQVLATSFNINAYQDEPTSKTTLLEGRIKVSRDGQARILQPGQQAIIANTGNNNGITVQTADIEATIAWKEGRFYFNSTPLTAVMRQLERWYGIKVVYPTGSLDAITFSGAVSRMNNISEVLRMLELTGMIRFELGKDQINVYRLNE